ncbi:MAG: hypothetical protein IJ085_01615 [Turicibacter sp.]|nr:hypothetical protein [Turicibacter sp.]
MNTLNLGDVVKLKTISEILFNSDYDFMYEDEDDEEDVVYNHRYNMYVILDDELDYFNNAEECMVKEITTIRKYIDGKEAEYTTYTLRTKDGDYLYNIFSDMFVTKDEIRTIDKINMARFLLNERIIGFEEYVKVGEMSVSEMNVYLQSIVSEYEFKQLDDHHFNVKRA